MAVDIQPEFQVEWVEGNFTRTVTFLEETTTTKMVAGVERQYTTRKMVPKPDTFTKAVMIYYPQGHSIMVAADDTEQLIQLGVTKDPRLVDMESGDLVPEGYNLTPKEIVARKERNRPRSTQGGISVAMGE